MSHLVPSLTLLTSIVLAFFWIQSPLEPYALQGFAAAVLLFFVLKRLAKAKLWHIVPGENILEMALLTFAFLLLIGATGNTESVFFPLGYVHLFLLVLAMSVPTALVTTGGVLFFHLTLSQSSLAGQFNELVTIPLLLLFFLFAKKQYDEVQVEKALLKQEHQRLTATQEEEASLKSFLADFLLPKLNTLEDLVMQQTGQGHPNQAAQGTSNQGSALQQQFSLLKSETQKLLSRLHQATGHRGQERQKD